MARRRPHGGSHARATEGPSERSVESSFEQSDAHEDSGTATEKRASVDRVVAIGASAGGLEALQELLGVVPATSRSAFVIAQHLSPSHPTLIVDLLARATALHVVEAVDGAPLAAGTVMVVPPDRDITVTRSGVAVTPATGGFGPSPSVDTLFVSLAEAWGERGTAIVLSGTGSDGAHGLRVVRGAGGLTMVQNPESARFDGMPRAAIALGGAELIDDADALGRSLDALGPDAALAPGETGQVDEIEATGALGKESESERARMTAVTVQLKRATGIDVSGYKASTLRRQIERRMALRRVQDLADYEALLKEDPSEPPALLGNLLVTVTSFFRDPEAFASLGTALAARVAAADGDEPIRVWVPGCATGEEVYSIAMLIGEALGFPTDLDRLLKIYGTDLDEASLAIARRATYPASVASQIPERLRSVYLRKDGDEVRVSDVIREAAVFARHDVCADPPFPRLDLVSCRNVLIYFTPSLQQQVLGALRFALKPGGLLFLGKAENIEASVQGFAPVDPEHRLFTRTGAAPRIDPGPMQARQSAHRPVPRPRASTAAPEPALEQQVALLEALVRFTEQSFLVLDDDHRLVQVVGDVSAFCRVPEGPVTTEVGAFLRPELQDEARALFLLCRADRTAVRGQPVRVAGLEGLVHLTASPLTVGGAPFTVLSFANVAEEAGADSRTALLSVQRPEFFSRELARLERELLASQDTLRRSLAELQASNEELEATSEELQASSEELQAANEELQASNEELQASNEELATLNDELRARGDALERANIDLENIQASLTQGMVIIDAQAQVTRFSPLAVRLFALVDADLGTPLWRVPTTMPVPGLEDAVTRVIAGEPRISIEATDGSTSYLVQVQPYRGPAGESLGAIVTVTDVSELLRLRAEAESALAELQAKSDLLQQQAAYDFTTGLLNRAYFTSSLEHEIDRAHRAGTPIALACIDLDRFKEVNDELGHGAGDHMLRSVGERILGAVRSTDIVGRLGGDEFAVLVSGYENPQELDTVLERILVALRKPMSAGEREARIAASIGIAVYPDNAAGADALLRAADAAMYAVKRSGGDAFGFFDHSMNSAAAYRRTMRQEIERAIEADAFELHYQPIVAASDGAVWGVEAVMRWNRGDRVVEAHEFVPFCEFSGQIRAMGRTTLRQLREHVRVLDGAGYGSLSVCANLSVAQLEDPQLLEVFEGWPSSDGLRGLVIEIVESVFLPDHHVALGTLEALVERGAGASIDDFGSGYSNFRLLERLRPDFIKLDRSFLGEDQAPLGRLALVRAAIEVAHVIGARVIAEGIEAEGQLEVLRDARADFVQGFGIAPAMPLPELLTWLADRAVRTDGADRADGVDAADRADGG